MNNNTPHKYDVECFISSKLCFGYLVETVVMDSEKDLYNIRLTRWDPEQKLCDRVVLMQSTLNGVSFETACEKIQRFKEKYL